jgi:hypothetical protein
MQLKQTQEQKCLGAFWTLGRSHELTPKRVLTCQLRFSCVAAKDLTDLLQL